MKFIWYLYKRYLEQLRILTAAAVWQVKIGEVDMVAENQTTRLVHRKPSCVHHLKNSFHTFHITHHIILSTLLVYIKARYEWVNNLLHLFIHPFILN